MKILPLLLFCLCFCQIESAKILVTVMWMSSSHFLNMLPTLQRLLSNGHEITVWHEISSQNPAKLPSDFISYRAEVPPELMEIPKDDSLWNDNIRPLDHIKYWGLGSMWHNEILINKRALFEQVLAQKWDLIISDSLFSFSGIDFGLHNAAPLAIFHTTYTELPYSYYRGRSRPLGTEVPMYSSLNGAQFSVSNFLDRLYAAQSNVELLGTFLFPVERIVNSAISIPDFCFYKWVAKSPIGFTDYPDTICWPLPLTMETIHVGTCPKTQAKSLPEDLEQFVSDPDSHGTILVALGSVIDWGTAPADRREALLDALGRLTDYRVIWAYKGPQLKLPSHIRTMAWVPQTDILGHRKTKLFVTHGGLKSLMETICNEVPGVFMPIFAEQAMNAFVAKRLGFGGFLDKRYLTGDNVYNEIIKVLDCKLSLANVEKAKAWWTDKIMDPVELGAFWTEKLFKTGIAEKFFKPRGTSMNVIQSACIDLLLGMLGFSIACCKLLGRD